MNAFLRQNWFKVSFLAVAIAMAGAAFYWFQWRPTQIRKECVKQHPLAFFNNTGGLLGQNDEAGYKRCLLEHGLEK